MEGHHRATPETGQQWPTHCHHRVGKHHYCQALVPNPVPLEPIPIPYSKPKEVENAKSYGTVGDKEVTFYFLGGDPIQYFGLDPIGP